MRIDVLTLFPEVFEPFLAASIVGRAIEAGILTVRCVNFRDFAHDKHRTADDRPFGGGPGMVLMCGPVFEALEHLEHDEEAEPTRVILTPQGARLDHEMAAGLAGEPWLILLCGHYEGFDERIRTGLVAREISIGDYVLSGGEPAAMVLIDAVARLLPGAFGDEEPQYTRPRDFRGMTVPEVLLSGDHARIEAWRRAQAKERTLQRRPDLLKDD